MTDSTDRSRPVYRGGATTYGEEHRAHARVESPRRVVAEAVGLGVVSTALWVAALPGVSRLWGRALAGLAPDLGAAGVRMALTDVGGVATVGVPYLDLEMGLPGPLALFASGLAVLALWLATAFLPERWRPGVYLARAVLLVHASAVAYFALWPERFPYALPDYLHGMTAAGLAVATATPVVLALVLHVQDLSLGRKAAFTALALGYSVVLVPLQYAVQGWVLAHATALAMPVLYLFGGVPLHVLTLVALYAWAMSWPGRLPALGVPDEGAAPLLLPVDARRQPAPRETPAFADPDPDDLVPSPAAGAPLASAASDTLDPSGLDTLDAVDRAALDGEAPPACDAPSARPALFTAGGDGAEVTGRLDLPPDAPAVDRAPVPDIPEWTSLATQTPGGAGALPTDLAVSTATAASAALAEPAGPSATHQAGPRHDPRPPVVEN